MARQPLIWRQQGFSGGMVYRLSRGPLAPNEVEWLENFEINEHATAVRRAGFEKMNATPLAGAVQGIHEYEKEDDTKELLVLAGGTLYVWNGSTFNQVATGLDAGADTRAKFVHFGDLIIILNRVDPPQKYDIATQTLAPLAGSPPIAGTGAVFYHHLFLADIPSEPIRVYHSETANAEDGYATKNYFFDAAVSDLSPVVALESMPGELVIGKKSSVTALRGTEPRDFSSPQNQSAYTTARGVVGRFALINVDGVPWFFSNDGIFSINGPYNTPNQSWAIEGMVAELDGDHLESVVGLWRQGRGQVVFWAPRAVADLDVALVGQVGTGRNGLPGWSIYTGPTATISAPGVPDPTQAQNIQGALGGLIYYGTADGHVFRSTTAENKDDDGVAFESIIKTDRFDFGDHNQIKLMREVDVELEIGGSADADLVVRTDDGVFASERHLSQEDSGFIITGEGVTGGLLGIARVLRRFRVLLPHYGGRHQLEIRSGGSLTDLRVVSLSAIGYLYGRRRMPGMTGGTVTA